MLSTQHLVGLPVKDTWFVLAKHSASAVFNTASKMKPMQMNRLPRLERTAETIRFVSRVSNLFEISPLDI
jgi:hypothetical protein